MDGPSSLGEAALSPPSDGSLVVVVLPRLLTLNPGRGLVKPGLELDAAVVESELSGAAVEAVGVLPLPPNLGRPPAEGYTNINQ